MTVQMIQRRFLLRPSRKLNRIIVGILARAKSRHPVDVMAAVFMSNHYHLLLWTPDAATLAGFMQKVNYNLSREVSRLHGWRGTLLARRYDAIPVSHEEAAQVERLKYILAHGAKEDLVPRPGHWPGVHCARELISGKPLRGVWFDGTGACHAQRRARRTGKTFRPADHSEPKQLLLAKLPCWKHLSDQEYRCRVAELLHEVEKEVQERRRMEGKSLPSRTVCVREITRQHPHQSPKSPLPRRRRPHCHAATRRVRNEMRRARTDFLAAYRSAARRLREGDRDATFPDGCFPPAPPFVGSRSVRAP